MRVMVTGHRGYIGSVMVSMLKELGIFCIGVDKGERGYSDLLVDHSVGLEVSNEVVTEYVLKHNITHIFHFAASAAIADSVTNPALYYWNNLGETAKFLGNLHQAGWKGKFIFSSTAAVYGEAGSNAFEEQKKNPCNPYGHSKLMCEQAMEDICYRAGIDGVIFRYFNVAGAYNDTGDHLDSDHILPKICSAVYDKKPFRINGDSYETRDGTCVRDYVHVLDICRAHLHASDFLETKKGLFTFNLGSNEGFTNKEIVEAFKTYTGEELDWEYGPNRPGDPPLLIADNSKFNLLTGFEYKHTDLEKIVTSAWEWYKKCKMRNEK
jgi:UDP-glucose 4-epimerase